MIDIKDRIKGVTDREQWAARGASFVAKAKATKVVWFPPEPVETGKKAASTAKKATKKAAKKPSGAARKTTAAAKKSTGTSTKKVSSPVRRKKA
ncbi:hypothetical protein GCM10009844_29710 [Nocardioides koreensis]|uniref:Histone n=1 Tax=Nocardioides koreensis TaxID=433651 RepID=A0ABP5LLP1_9ACTN